MNQKCLYSLGCALILWASAPHVVLASGCPGNPGQSVGPDVIVGDITGPSNYTVSGGLEALSLGTTSCNLGNAQLKWDQCPANTHPVIGGNLFRWNTVSGATRFEQVGQSWLKHGFTALQGTTCCSNCQSSGTGTRLGIGCSDPYSSDRNGQQGLLGPKYTVNAHTGVYPAACATHPSGGNLGRLEVATSDLIATTGGAGATTRYWSQAQYVASDDSTAHNQNNNASSREITVSGSGSAFTFGFLGSTQREIPAIRQWKNMDAGVLETDVNTPEDDGFNGLVIMDAKATNLGGGVYHYEFAVNNLNSDRSVAVFTVPVSPYATVTNIGFHDVAYRGPDGVGGVTYDGTDWPGAFSSGQVSWATTPFAMNNNANAIRWGTMYNFRFDANLAPTTGNVTLGQYKVVNNVLASTTIPSSVSCVKGDVNGDGLINGADIAMFAAIVVNGGGTPTQRCACDMGPADFLIDANDVNPFANCILAGGGCP